MEESFRAGDIVSFELVDQCATAPKPYGYGKVIRVLAGPLIQPDHPLPPKARLTNIKKVA
jgi:hypothetical protein